MRAAFAILALSALFAVPVWAQAPAEAPLITGAPQWLERHERAHNPPPPAELPPGALVVLDCLVGSDGTLAYSILSEGSSWLGIGDFALRVSRGHRMAPLTLEGQPTAGWRYRMRIPFEPR